MSFRRRETFFILFFISALISISGNSYALIAWGDDADEQMQKIAINQVIPPDMLSRYDYQDMMVFEKFVDRQSRRALKAFALPGQQAVISYKNGIETIIVETARLPEDNPVIIVPIPVEYEVGEGSQDIFPELSNNVFRKLFGQSNILTVEFEYAYEHKKGNREDILKQREHQRNVSMNIKKHYSTEGLKTKEALKVHKLPSVDVLILDTDDTEEFIAFFDENFYKIPGSKKPVIDYYLKKNQRFAVINVPYPEKGEINPPVKFTFKTPEIIFPLKISAINNPYKDKTNINLFVFSDKDFGAKNFYRIWQGDKKEITSDIDMEAFPERLTVLTGILDNLRIETELEPTSAKTSVWIFPVNRNSSGFYIFITILWVIIIFAVLYLEKIRYIKPVSRFRKSIAVCLLISLIMLSVVSIKDRNRGDACFMHCQKNIKELMTALEMYSTDNGGKYPDRLGKLVPGYIKAIPKCPDSGTDSYSYPSYRQYKTRPSFSHRHICRNRHTGVKGWNRKPVVFPMCGEIRIVLDEGK